MYFQVPVLPELGLMADDIKTFDPLFKDNRNNDEKVQNESCELCTGLLLVMSDHVTCMQASDGSWVIM